jgi:hypothetical protein
MKKYDGHHGTMRDAQWSIVHYGRDGHPGVGKALDLLQDRFWPTSPTGKASGRGRWTALSPQRWPRSRARDARPRSWAWTSWPRGWARDKALELDADLVAIDSIKDVLPKASDEERAGLYNMARQAALASGIDWMELHHNRKAGVGNKEPDTLEDVYGARWLMAGAGSVISLFGESGASVVSMKQLKAPAGEFFPRWVELDKGKGMLALHDNLTVESLAARATAGTSALLVARKIYSTEKPDRSQVQSVRNKFKRLAGQGVIEEYASTVDGTQMFRATSSNALATPQQRDTATPATDTPSSQVKAATPSSNTSNDPATFGGSLIEPPNVARPAERLRNPLPPTLRQSTRPLPGPPEAGWIMTTPMRGSPIKRRRRNGHGGRRRNGSPQPATGPLRPRERAACASAGSTGASGSARCATDGTPSPGADMATIGDLLTRQSRSSGSRPWRVAP